MYKENVSIFKKGNTMTIEELRIMIEKSILPLIDRDYVFLDFPYHPNVGDSLIAYAAESLLKKSSHHCLYRSSEYTFDDRIIPSDVLIIFNGGGNFGDLWKNYTVFRNRIIKKYPNNKFLILPQSVCYREENNLLSDIDVYSKCGKSITICARDNSSYNLLKRNFVNNNVILVPDMAFYTDPVYLAPNPKTGRVLFLNRKDVEFLESSNYTIIPENSEVHDWPTIERFWWIQNKYVAFKRYTLKKWYPRCFLHIEDFLWQKMILPYYLHNGISFVNKYDTIYSTRLHVAILGVLLNKNVYFFNNSYGKNFALYDTWLRDFSNVKCV